MSTYFEHLSNQELKTYWRSHPHDPAAQQAYLDRLNQSPRPVITSIDDPDFDIKLDAEIQRQMKAASN